MESREHLSNCDCCDGLFARERQLVRRDFLKTAGGAVIGAGALAAGLPIGRVFAEAKAAGDAAAASTPESLVKVLFESLSPKQREAICFPWNFQHPELGLLRTRVSANWDITDYFIDDDAFYTKDQQHIIRGIYEGIINPEWHQRIDKQLEDDAGGYGEQNSIAIFGEPGGDQFEFVMTGRHMTIRADGNTAKHVAFGGPIFYGHAAEGFAQSIRTMTETQVQIEPTTAPGPNDNVHPARARRDDGKRADRAPRAPREFGGRPQREPRGDFKRSGREEARGHDGTRHPTEQPQEEKGPDPGKAGMGTDRVSRPLPLDPDRQANQAGHRQLEPLLEDHRSFEPTAGLQVRHPRTE